MAATRGGVAGTLIPDSGIRDEWRGDANRESLREAAVAAAAVDAPAKESGCSRCVALQQQVEAQRWELVRERCAARSFRSLHERACARGRAKQEEVKALRADISRAAALRKEVEDVEGAAGGAEWC